MDLPIGSSAPCPRAVNLSNFAAVNMGVETASDRLMELIDKKERVEDNVKAIKMCREVGIMTDTYIDLRIANRDAKRPLRYDQRLMNSLPVDSARYNLAMPFPGTRFFKIAKEENRLHVHEDWSNFSSQYYMVGDDVPYLPKDTAGAVLIFDIIFANLIFYFRPRILYKTFFNKFLSVGGGALSLPKRWYLKPAIVITLMKFALLLIKRVVIISFNASMGSLRKKA